MAVVVPIAADYDPSGVKQATTEFQLFGRTMEKVFQDAARSARKSFDQVEAAADTTTTGLKKTAGEADRSRSVFANFAGNAAQEIPGISAAFGPLNTAIGQFTEYAAEGNISLKGFVSFAGPLAGVSAGLALISGYFANIKESANFAKERVQNFTQSLRDGKSAAEALRDEFAKGVTVRANDPNAFGGLGQYTGQLKEGIRTGNLFVDSVRFVSKFLSKETSVDITPILTRAGLDPERIAQLTANGGLAIDRYIASLKRAGVSSKDLGTIQDFLTKTADQLAESQKAAAATAEFFGQKSAAATGDLNGLGAALGYTGVEARKAAENLAATERAILDLKDTALASVNAEFAYADAQDDVADSVARAQQARAKARKSNKPEDIRAAERAERDVTRAVLRQGQAFGELAASQNTAATGLQDSTVAAKAFEESVSKAAQKFRQGGAIRGPLEEFANSLRTTFPTDIRTRIVFDFATGSVSIGGTKGSPFGGGLFVPGVSVPTITTNNKTDVRVNVNGFIGNNVQLAEILRRVLNEGANRRASGGFFA